MEGNVWTEIPNIEDLIPLWRKLHSLLVVGMEESEIEPSSLGKDRDWNRRYYKPSQNPPEARWRCCRSARNAHILSCMLRFFAALRLALEPDPEF